MLTLLLALTLPNPAFTPGEIDGSHEVKSLCSGGNKNYPRHVTEATKARVAKQYGVPRSEWPNYEFDHLIAHCAGGSDGPNNIWPQRLTEARVKDRFEVQWCRDMCAGKRKQSEVVDLFRNNSWARP